MIVQSARTRDGVWVVHLHDDQTAELYQGRWRILGRSKMWEVGRRLVEEGVDWADLIPD